MQRIERRLLQREELLDKKLDAVEHREDAVVKKQKEVQKSYDDAKELYNVQLKELERISNLSSEEAKQLLLSDIEKQIKHEAAMMIKDIETKAKEEGERKVKEIVSYAIQKCSADHVAETTVSGVALPNDEMKGRIIGREGLNSEIL